MNVLRGLAACAVAVFTTSACTARPVVPETVRPAGITYTQGTATGLLTEAACTDTGAGGLRITVGDSAVRDRVTIDIVDNKLTTVEVVRDGDRLVVPVVRSAGDLTYDDGLVVADGLEVSGDSAEQEVGLEGSARCR